MSKAVIWYEPIDISKYLSSITNEDVANGFEKENLYDPDPSCQWGSSSGAPANEKIILDMTAATETQGIAVLNHNMLTGDTVFSWNYGATNPPTGSTAIPYPGSDPTAEGFRPNSYLKENQTFRYYMLEMQRASGGQVFAGRLYIPRKRYEFDQDLGTGKVDWKISVISVETENTAALTAFQDRTVEKVKRMISADLNFGVTDVQMKKLEAIALSNYIIFFPFGDEPGFPFYYCTFRLQSFSGFVENNATGETIWKGSIMMDEQVEDSE